MTALYDSAPTKVERGYRIFSAVRGHGTGGERVGLDDAEEGMLRSQLRRHFDGISGAYYTIVDAIWYAHGYYHRKEAQFLRNSLQAGLQLAIDAGCGPGRHCHLLATLAKRVIAVDISRRMLVEARDHQSPPASANIEYVQADVTMLPFKNRAADCIVNLEVLEHLPGGEKGVLAALASFRRVLVSRGRLITNVPLFFHAFVDSLAPPTLKEVDSEAWTRYYELAPLLVENAFRGNAVEKSLELTGFRVLERNYIRVLPARVIERFPNLVPIDELMERIPIIRRAARELVWLAEAW